MAGLNVGATVGLLGVLLLGAARLPRGAGECDAPVRVSRSAGRRVRQPAVPRAPTVVSGAVVWPSWIRLGRKPPHVSGLGVVSQSRDLGDQGRRENGCA